MNGFYTGLCEKCHLDENLVSKALEFSEKIDFDALAALFYAQKPDEVLKKGGIFFSESFYPYDFFFKARSEFKNQGVDAELGFICLYISLLPKAYCDFEARSIPKNIFFDTITRILDEEKRFLCNKNERFDYIFLANFLRGSILRLGVFDYQIGVFGKDKALFLHISDRADLTKRYDSYKKAFDFFGDLPIIADSWLLYKEHKKMLPEGSNIRAFLDDFNIITTSEGHDYNELFHVFGREFDISNPPTSTLLQKAYAERIKNHLPIGSAMGMLKKETV